MTQPVLNKWYKIFQSQPIGTNVVGFREQPDYVGFLASGPSERETYIFKPVYTFPSQEPSTAQEHDFRVFDGTHDMYKVELIQSSSSSPENIPLAGGRRRKTRRSKHRKSRSRRCRK
jgi:hypothetical protein